MLRRRGILLLLLLIINFYEVTPRSMMDRILSNNVEINESLKFSILPSRSDIQQNMIIIGIRFARRTSKICMEIKQGKLLPGGEIDRNSEGWTSCNVSWSSSPAYGLEESNRPNVDYVKIDKDLSYVDLDDLVEQNDRIVTGVAFELSDQCLGVQHLKLRLEYTGFNFTSGRLDSHRTSLSSFTCQTNEMNMTDTNSRLDHAESGDQNIDNPISKGFVRFNLSNFKENSNQMMQLLLNDQFLESDPSAPLTDVGVFYETFQRVDGGLALRIRFLNDYPNVKSSGIIDRSSYDDLHDNDIIRRVKRAFPEKFSSYIFYILIYIVFKISMICMFCKCGRTAESQTWNCRSNKHEILVNADPCTTIPMPAPDHMT